MINRCLDFVFLNMTLFVRFSTQIIKYMKKSSKPVNKTKVNSCLFIYLLRKLMIII